VSVRQRQEVQEVLRDRGVMSSAAVLPIPLYHKKKTA